MLLAILAAAAVATAGGAAETAAAPADAAPAAVEAAAEAKAAKPKKARSDMVCVSEKMMGSNRPTKVCYPRKAPPADTGAAKMPEVDAQR